jgi:16S rRNA (cytosine967-C5)-methyltransferase
VTDRARSATLELLTRVRTDDAYANVVMPSILAAHGCEGRDAGFAVEVGYGTLRMQGFLDAVLQRCVTREWDRVEYEVRDLLRLGAYQLLFMRVPPHAAIDTTCELARRHGDAGRVGFINAVLRKVSQHDRSAWIDELGVADPITDEQWSVRESHPEWVVRELRRALPDPTQLGPVLEADNVAARPVLAALDGDRDGLVTATGGHPGRWSPRAVELTGGSPGNMTAVLDGSAIVQDEGSQLVALALAAATVDPPEAAWLDLCAGPGGKAALLARIAGERNISFVAVELHEHRASLMARVLPGAVTVFVGDARARPWGNQFFDRVLLDAPCSGLGALRRRPEARWRRSESDLAPLQTLQIELLNAAVGATRSGGVIGYATCSPVLEETREVVDEVLERRSDVVVEDARPLFPSGMELGKGPWVQLWPHIHGTDAMFFALLRRR